MIPIIFIIIILYYCFYYFVKRELKTEPFAPDIPYTNLQKIYKQRHEETKNINNVLKREIHNGNKKINEIIGLENNTIGRFVSVNSVGQYIGANLDKKIEEIKKNQKLKNKEIINIYNELYYYDSCYPKEPISVDFALNPIEFIKTHPDCYPSYIILKEGGAALT